jgi:hypothetical protein
MMEDLPQKPEPITTYLKVDELLVRGKSLLEVHFRAKGVGVFGELILRGFQGLRVNRRAVINLKVL